MNARLPIAVLVCMVFAIGVAAASSSSVAPVITSPTHVEGVPANASVARFDWSVAGDASGVTYFHALTPHPTTEPTDLDNSTQEATALVLLPSLGQWYFHVVATSGGERSAVGHYGPVSRNLTLEQQCAAAFPSDSDASMESGDSGLAGCITAAQHKFAPEAILGLFMAFLAKFGSATLRRG